MMKWFHFILSHSIFVSVCATALCLQTFLLLQIPQNNIIYPLVFSSTLCSYNLYWLISKFHFTKDGTVHEFVKRHLTNLLLFFVSGIAVVILLFKQPEIIPSVITAVVLTLLYSLPLWPVRQLHFLRKLGYLKTILLAFTWSFVTVIIPSQISFFEMSSDMAILFIARFSFMLLLCSIFDERDVAIDKIRSLSSLATHLGRKSMRIIMILTFVIYIISGLLLRYTISTQSQVMAFFITGIVVLLVYIASLKKQGYMFYYFIVDGLMLFSAAATYVASI